MFWITMELPQVINTSNSDRVFKWVTPTKEEEGTVFHEAKSILNTSNPAEGWANSCQRMLQLSIIFKEKLSY